MDNLHKYGRSSDTVKIWKLHLAGYNVHRIQKKLGFKHAKVTSAIRRGRDIGALPQPVFKNSCRLGLSTFVRLGSVSSILAELDKNQLDWLKLQIKQYECETVAEMMLEYVRDAYEEQLTKKG